MSLHTLFLLLLLLVIALFTALNWSAFTAPTTLSLVFTTIQAPLGLIMLGIAALLGALFLAYVVYLQTSVIIEARRYARELKAQRDIADQAEASRFTELRTLLEVRLDRIDAAIAASDTGAEARLRKLGDELRASVERAGDTLAAYIGEVEDRLERAIGRPASG